MKTSNLLTGTGAIIDAHLSEIIGRRARFDTKQTAIDLKPPGGDLQIMIDALAADGVELD